MEYPVGGTKGGRVDIALRANTRGQNRLVALVEAKAPGSDLKRHVAQVLGYAFHEGVDICVLTTGLEWWLFLPRESGEPIKRRFATLNMQSDSVERLAEDLRAFLDKEALVRGRAEKKAKSVLKATLDAARLETEIPEIWERMLNGPDQELVDLIGARVYERLNLRPDKSQVIAALRANLFRWSIFQKIRLRRHLKLRRLRNQAKTQPETNRDPAMGNTTRGFQP